jgi:hypothetical protein
MARWLDSELTTSPKGSCPDPELIDMIMTGNPVTVSGPSFDDLFQTHIQRCKTCSTKADGFLKRDELIRETRDSDVGLD